MSTVIDAHQHVWDLTRSRYDWLGPDLAPIDRTIEFAELRPSLRRAGVDGTVLVQSADTPDDTELMLDVAANNPEVVAVVAYLPLGQPDEVASQAEKLRDNSLVVGVRNLIHTLPDPEWLLRPEVDDSLGILESEGLTFDVVSVLPAHLALVPKLSERHPKLRMVIDHLSKPPIGLAEQEPWWSLIADASKSPMVYAKVSGLYSATADSGSWTVDSVRPYLHRALETFGSSRLMFGGDWPISILSGGYDRVWDGLRELVSELPQVDQARIWSESAIEFYGIDPARVAAAVAARA
ncbi:MAG TPA: amidohydrolase family protein [Galbitalea sp.]|jgi:L-fuconolactonase|nr:amidohydrolase family protein [Galbitalea sp.]